MVMRWEEVIALAVPGTARVAAATPDPAHADQTALLLQSAAVHAVARRAGAPAAQATTSLPAPCPPETAPVLRGRHWIQGERPPIGAFLRQLAERGVVADPATTPALLMAMADTPALRWYVNVIGEAGRWIAAQRDDWAFAAGGPLAPGQPASADDRVWREGTTTERITWLAHRCQTDPAVALAVARTALTGRGERADLRAQVIEVLASTPGPLDPAEREALLEAARADRSQQVREAARDALVQVGSLPLRARAEQYAARYLTLTSGRRGATIELALPARPSEEEAADGVSSPTALRQYAWQPWLGALPLAWWQERAGGATPRTLVAATIRGSAAGPDAQTAVRAAWAWRVQLDGDAEWAAALAEADADLARSVAAHLRPPDAERLGVAALRGGDPGMQLLAAIPQPWPGRLLDAFMQALPTLIADRAVSTWSTPLAAVAEHGDPRALALLPTAVDATPSAIGHLNRAREHLAWRAQLTTALDALTRAERSA